MLKTIISDVISGPAIRSEGEPMSEEAKERAFDAIHDEALRLLSLELKLPNEVRQGLEWIVSVARYRFVAGPNPNVKHQTSVDSDE